MSPPRKQALGRGLGEIFSGTGSDSGLPREVPVGNLGVSKWQPRQNMEPTALGELAQTIAARGVLQPIIARPAGSGKFEIVAGERRWRAAKLAGLRTVPVVVRDFSDRDAMLAALVENIQREDLGALEQATAARRIIDELKLPIKDAALALGMSRPALSNLLRLLDLAEPVRKLIADKSISPGHARAIATLPAQRQVQLAKAIIKRNLTVRQAEALGKAMSKKPGKHKPGGKKVDADTARLERDISAKLGMNVHIQPRGKSGKLTVHYRSLDSLDSLIRLLLGKK